MIYPFQNVIRTHINVYCCIISPQLHSVSHASDAVVVGVGIDIDIGIYAIREQPSRMRAALVTSR